MTHVGWRASEWRGCGIKPALLNVIFDERFPPIGVITFFDTAFFDAKDY